MPHILMLPSWYPTLDQPVLGCFFKEFAASMHAAGEKIGIIYPDMRQLRTLSPALVAKNYFQKTHTNEDGIPTIRWNGWNLYPKFLKRQMLFWSKQALNLAYAYCYKYGKPDLLHAQSSIWGGVAAKIIAEQLNIPYLITEHRDYFCTGQIFGKDVKECWSTHYLRSAFDDAKAIIAVSNPLKKSLGLYTTKNQNDIMVIPNAVDVALFHPGKETTACKPFTFFTLGGLVPRKNNALLIKAFKIAIEAINQPLRLEIGGNGPERAMLERLVLELNLEKQVVFLGQLSRMEASSAFRSSNAFVLPSKNESFGVVCIEALASGIPVISTRCEGPEDIINDDLGILVENDNHQDLAKGMLHVYRNHESYRPDVLHQHAKNKYGKDVITKAYQNLYRKVKRPHY